MSAPACGVWGETLVDLTAPENQYLLHSSVPVCGVANAPLHAASSSSSGSRDSWLDVCLSLESAAARLVLDADALASVVALFIGRSSPSPRWKRNVLSAAPISPASPPGDYYDLRSRKVRKLAPVAARQGPSTAVQLEDDSEAQWYIFAGLDSQ